MSSLSLVPTGTILGSCSAITTEPFYGAPAEADFQGPVKPRSIAVKPGVSALGKCEGGEEGSMRTIILILSVFTGLALAGPAGAATTKTVNIYSSFSPSSVTITAGDTVKWVNRTDTTRQIY